MITARIKKDETGFGLWLLVDNDDYNENTAWPIEEDEIDPIMEACREYLKIHQKE